MGYMTSNSSLVCSCGRTFTQHNALSYHQRTCPKTARRISGAFTKFKALLDGRKRRRLEVEEAHEEHELSLGLAHPVQQEVRYGQTYVPTPKTHCILQAGPSILPLQGYAGSGQVPYMLNGLTR